MKLLKLISIFILAFIIALPTIATSQADVSGLVARKIKDSGVIIIGVQENSVPFSYKDDRQLYVGYSVDLCKKLAEGIRQEIGLDNLAIRFLPVTSSSRIPLIANGTIDLVCGSTTNNLERQKLVAFAPTMYVAAGRIMVKKSLDVYSLDDLKNKTLGLITGGSITKSINQTNNAHNLNIKIIYSSDANDLFLMLNNGRINAIATDDSILAGLIANSNNPDDYVILDQILSVEPYAIMMPLGDANFKKLVTDILTKIYQSNQIKVIYDRWFLSAIPPKGANLNIPMSKELKAVLDNPTDSGDPIDYLGASGVKTRK
jgi:glutamate/aspartate transport system substrate-binding protein